MQRTPEPTPRDKKKYRKPTVRMIPLRAEEALLGACKSATSGALNGGGTCTVPVNCSSIGS